MVRKEKLDDIGKKEAIELIETTPSSDEFDLSVLESDIKDAEKEARDLRNQVLIKQADIQKGSETDEVDIEKIQDFNEFLQEAVEFFLEFANKPLKKIGITPFKETFVKKFIKKLLDMLPTDYVSKIKASVEITDKTKKGFRLFKIFRFMTFITKELSKRYDEYQAYLETKDPEKEAE